MNAATASAASAATDAGSRPVRLLGAGVHNFKPAAAPGAEPDPPQQLWDAPPAPGEQLRAEDGQV